MKIEEIHKLAVEKTPKVPTTIAQDCYRHDVIRSLQGNDNIGIELGVAGGVFSQRMVASGKFKTFYGVDLYSDHHDTGEYVRALKHVGINENYKLLRMSFDEAVELFDDSYFDFIYFDGYAHTGEEGGKSFIDWYQKVKIGGIIAGDDYHQDWPLVQWAVNTFAQRLGVELTVTGLTETTNLSHYPSWFFTKVKDVEFNGMLDEQLFSLGQKVKEDVAKNRNGNAPTTLTLDQVFQFSEAVCRQHPQYVAKFAEIVERYSRP